MCGNCVRQLCAAIVCGNVAIGCGNWVWQLGVAIGCGNWVWQLGVAIGCGNWVWQLGVAIGCGNWVWQLGVAILTLKLKDDRRYRTPRSLLHTTPHPHLHPHISKPLMITCHTINSSSFRIYSTPSDPPAKLCIPRGRYLISMTTVSMTTV